MLCRNKDREGGRGGEGKRGRERGREREGGRERGGEGRGSGHGDGDSSHMETGALAIVYVPGLELRLRGFHQLTGKPLSLSVMSLHSIQYGRSAKQYAYS